MEKMKKLLMVCLICVGTITMNAQNVGISATGIAPSGDAGLDVNFTDKGVLIPRVSLSSLTTYNPPITGGGPTTSMLIYNTNTTIGVGYYYWDGGKWVKLLVTGSPSDAWLTLGNAGTTPGTHFLGTTDNKDLVFKTNNTEKMRITSGGNVGIGTTGPGAKLDVAGTSVGSNLDVLKLRNDNANAPGNAVSIDFHLKRDIGTSPRVAKIQAVANPSEPGWPKTDLAFYTNNEEHPAGLSEKMRILYNGNVGIGTTTPAHLLELSVDDAVKPGGGSWSAPSDERLKNITGKYSKGLKEILQLNPITYYYKNTSDYKFDPKVLEKENIGFSAQQVSKIFPEAVAQDPNGYLSFNIHPILVAYVNAIKELAEKDKELELKNKELENKVKEIELLKKDNEILKAEVEKIKRYLDMKASK